MTVLMAAWIGQRLGNLLFGADVSGFFGALAMTPVALVIGRLPGGPPSQVTFLPAFWLLVPGALGLIGVTEIVGNPATASIADLVTPVGSIVSIALGILGGVSLYRALAEAPSRLRRVAFGREGGRPHWGRALATKVLARPHARSGDRRVPWQERYLRPRDRRVLPHICRAERARLS
jgi:uncharacterized membrane protein YjjB (DUF3815 family)